MAAYQNCEHDQAPGNCPQCPLDPAPLSQTERKHYCPLDCTVLPSTCPFRSASQTEREDCTAKSKHLCGNIHCPKHWSTERESTNEDIDKAAALLTERECCEKCWGEHDESGRGYCITQRSDWRERFDKEFTSPGVLNVFSSPERLKAFIGIELTQVRENVRREIKDQVASLRKDPLASVIGPETSKDTLTYNAGYNAAIKDVQAHLKNE